jgi:hypothetical protein
MTMAMTYVAMCLADALGAWRGLSEELEAPVEESSGSLTLSRLSSHLVRSGFCFIHFGKNCGIQMPQHARSVREGHREGRGFVRPSVVISGHQWSSVVINGHQRSSVVPTRAHLKRVAAVPIPLGSARHGALGLGARLLKDGLELAFLP